MRPPTLASRGSHATKPTTERIFRDAHSIGMRPTRCQEKAMPCFRIPPDALAEVRRNTRMSRRDAPMPAYTSALHSPPQTGTRPVPLLVPPDLRGLRRGVRTERTDRIFRSVPTS
nr:MAG TPA: hypothetical protein [Caudoviricetes sp.]